MRWPRPPTRLSHGKSLGILKSRTGRGSSSSKADRCPRDGAPARVVRYCAVRPLTGFVASASDRAAEIAEKIAPKLPPPYEDHRIDMWVASGTNVKPTFQPRAVSIVSSLIVAAGLTVPSAVPATRRTGIFEPLAYAKGSLAARAAAVVVAGPTKKTFRSRPVPPPALRS